jgi:alcohol dehydrogenase (NADP+)
MCNKCNDKNHKQSIHVEERKVQGRREFILSTAKTTASLSGLALAAPLMGLSSQALAAGAKAPVSLKPKKIQAFAVSKKSGSFKPITIERRALKDNDIEVEILYAGICHSDIHTINEDWGPNQYPVVPGHEIVGKVIAVGANADKFDVGDHVGIGCMVDSCGECVNCKNDREQNCLNGTTFTYGAPDKNSGGVTYGGYSRNVVVNEHFAVSIPKGMDLSRVAPIMCAGITTFGSSHLMVCAPFPEYQSRK